MINQDSRGYPSRTKHAPLTLDL